jgi:hypothetical protein
MIELRSNELVVTFPELPGTPTLQINFQRTLRIPDDGRDYPLPPGLGSFPLRHLDDFAPNVPADWLQRGGVLLPMWQSEALWLYFHSSEIEDREVLYPFALKIATGKISAITGEPWQRGLGRNPQNYLVVPEQPWLDGYCVEKGVIRQFVAMPLREGYSAEEQITGKAEFGGMQIEIFPMHAEVFERRFPKIERRAAARGFRKHGLARFAVLQEAGMGLAPGGRMRQEIYSDPYSIHDWDTEHSSRCFIPLVNSTTWQAITGQRPPSQPPTAQNYTRAGYHWFDYYDSELKALDGSNTLAALKSVKETAASQRATPLPDNESVNVSNIVNLRAGLKVEQVREADL